jgi:Protein of unknown function (DUF1566)
MPTTKQSAVQTETPYSPAIRTPPRTPPRIGAEWPGQGGIYAGVLRGENGAPDYHLIIATDPAGAIDSIAWGGAGKNEPGALSNLDGMANTEALACSRHSHPAAEWTRSLTIDGHSDYYLPARHELRLSYLNAPELFETDAWYWSSTQGAAISDYAWMQDFSDGSQNYRLKSSEYRARAVRRLIIQ